MKGTFLQEQRGMAKRVQRRGRWLVMSAMTMLPVATLSSLLGWSLHEHLKRWPVSVPSCSWPTEIAGDVLPDQAGLVRCYLKALDHADDKALNRVFDQDPPSHVSVDPVHAAHARSGRATVVFQQDPDSSATATAVVTYADGSTEMLILLMVKPESVHSWRIAGVHDA